MDTGFSGLQELEIDKKAWSTAVQGVAKSWTQLSDWTELNVYNKPGTNLSVLQKVIILYNFML